MLTNDFLDSLPVDHRLTGPLQLGHLVGFLGPRVPRSPGRNTP